LFGDPLGRTWTYQSRSQHKALRSIADTRPSALAEPSCVLEAPARRWDAMHSMISKIWLRNWVRIIPFPRLPAAVYRDQITFRQFAAESCDYKSLSRSPMLRSEARSSAQSGSRGLVEVPSLAKSLWFKGQTAPEAAPKATASGQYHYLPI